MKYLLILLTLILFFYFYQNNSIICLAIFGFSFGLTSFLTKNRDLQFFAAIISSLYIYQLVKTREFMTPLLQCDSAANNTSKLVDITSLDSLEAMKNQCNININSINTKINTSIDNKKKRGTYRTKRNLYY